MAIEPFKELLGHLPDQESWNVLRAEGFRPELIVDENIREIYEWAYDYTREYKEPPTEARLDEEFEGENFEEVDTPIGDLIELIRERYRKNQQRERLKKLGKLQNEDPSKVPQMMLTEGKNLAELLSRRGESYGNGDFDRMLKGYLDRSTKGPGPSLAFKEIDDFCYGQRGVTIYLGPPKTMKSWMLVKGALENIGEGNYPWLYSLELPAEETIARLMCMISKIPWRKYYRNELTIEEQDVMRKMSAELDGIGAYRITKPPEGERTIDHLVGHAQDAGAGVVFIDQLQYVEIDGKSLMEHNDTGKYAGVLNRARNLSDEIPICFAHQFNRSTLYNEEMPVVAQAKGSSSIEETSTLVLGLWANKEMRKSHHMEIGVLASRNGSFCNWEVEVDLSNDCSFDVVGIVDDA